jgi:hypothetical protein
MTTDLQAQIDNLLTWGRVRAWAEKQEGEIGESQYCSLCPIAKYLSQTTQEEWMVDSWYVKNRTNFQGVANLPPWAKEAVKQVDGLGEWIVSVTAEQFITILDACKPKEA